MTIEGKEQSQSPQATAGERLQISQQLLRRLDPFREGREAEKLRAIGLKNLYLQMADPSLEFLENVSGSLINMPFANLQELQFTTYSAGENPTRFFAKNEIIIDDSERYHAGISNFGELIDSITRGYDYETGQLNLGEELNPKALADSAYEQIQIRDGERQIKKMTEQLKDEPDLRRRYRMGLNLKREVLDYTGRFSFTFKYGFSDKRIEPTWENLTMHSGLSTELSLKDGSSIMGYFGISKAIIAAKSAITRYPLEKKLEQLPTIDKEQFDQLRLEYGAKAANQIIISKLANNINRAIKNRYDIRLAVPDFQAVPADLYRAWKEGKLTDDNLRPYFEWVNGLKKKERYDEEEHNADYIARSSAVFSEDGENVTGAGIYESVKVYGGGTFQDFKDAVTKVYESTNNSQAKAYRVQHGIKEEEMGLIIQRYVEPDSRFNMHGQSQEGYVNARLTGIPQLMEIVTRTSRNFVKRRELDFFLALDAYQDQDTFINVHHFPPDNYKVHSEMLIRVAQITFILEKIWKKDIQIEFVTDGFTINCVQVRELPSNTLSQAVEVKFPDEPPIHSGASIGVGDLELPVLDDMDDNSKKTGVVVLPSNHMWTMDRSNSYRLPKEGAVIVWHSVGKFGHIQTLCAEKGLICIFPDAREEDRPTIRYDELSGLKKVRIVSNGIEGRVYKIQQEDNAKEEKQD